MQEEDDYPVLAAMKEITSGEIIVTGIAVAVITLVMWGLFAVAHVLGQSMGVLP